MIEIIRTLVIASRYRLTTHARFSLQSRKISVDDIEDVFKVGKIIEKHIDDFGYECYLIYGERFNGDPIHIGCKMVEDYLQINTVYFPYEEFWEDNWQRRKKR